MLTDLHLGSNVIGKLSRSNKLFLIKVYFSVILGCVLGHEIPDFSSSHIIRVVRSGSMLSLELPWVFSLCSPPPSLYSCTHYLLKNILLCIFYFIKLLWLGIQNLFGFFFFLLVWIVFASLYSNNYKCLIKVWEHF